ncbi:hypothetical protein K2173_023654 [Erythroxylum novogranatense]|uniref:Uncharacterized protein n=1 Tax=Erythroxylum novogranatense TaxID=1862640 RepID=A0AAV8TS06_9ROSI|nr:hypothetical protein K2173_023654 [Erythroxylum novogranatense]
MSFQGLLLREKMGFFLGLTLGSSSENGEEIVMHFYNCVDCFMTGVFRVTIEVPWKSLGKEIVIVLIDCIFILAQPATDGHALKEEDKRKLFEAKLQQIEVTTLC